MGTYRKISNEEKTAVMTAVQAYLDQGWTFNSAYNQVKADFLSEEKTIPAENTVRRWFAGTARTETEETDPASPEGYAVASGAETDEATRDPEEADTENDEAAENPEEAAGADDAVQQNPDYTRRLELICRLYRTRSENAVDAVCDELLPELFTEEN